MKHLEKALSGLRDRLNDLATLVCKQVEDSISGILNEDSDLLKKVTSGDSQVDTVEVELEEECLRILALYQPVALDLRMVVAALKMNNDLERVGDLAVSIAQRGANIIKEKKRPDMPIGEMSKVVLTQLKRSIESFIKQDAHMARAVWKADGEINELHRTNYINLQQAMQNDSKIVPVGVSLLSVSRNLERIGDHSTNIAEDVIYLIDGDIVRHQWFV